MKDSYDRKFLEQIGINPDYYEWTQLAACQNLDVNLFFDLYETDRVIARQIDDLCLSCPVQKECYEFGRSNREQGLFGGFYLRLGTPDPERNSHKTRETVNKMARKVYDE